MTSPDGRWAYTLYGGGHETFIHALDTGGLTAQCIDLEDVNPRDIYQLGLNMDPASGELTVLERGKPVAVVDPQTFEVSDPPPAEAGGDDRREADSGGSSWVGWAAIGGGLVLIAALAVAALAAPPPAGGRRRGGARAAGADRRRGARARARAEREPVAEPVTAHDRGRCGTPAWLARRERENRPCR